MHGFGFQKKWQAGPTTGWLAERVTAAACLGASANEMNYAK
jgi:hypothetical protein